MENNVSIVGLIVLTFIVALVGTALIPSVAQTTGEATATEGIADTPNATLINLNVLMYSVLIMASVGGLAFLIMRFSGLV